MSYIHIPSCIMYLVMLFFAFASLCPCKCSYIGMSLFQLPIWVCLAHCDAISLWFSCYMQRQYRCKLKRKDRLSGSAFLASLCLWCAKFFVDFFSKVEPWFKVVKVGLGSSFFLHQAQLLLLVCWELFVHILYYSWTLSSFVAFLSILVRYKHWCFHTILNSSNFYLCFLLFDLVVYINKFYIFHLQLQAWWKQGRPLWRR